MSIENVKLTPPLDLESAWKLRLKNPQLIIKKNSIQ
jgi:hypothetical protein